MKDVNAFVVSEAFYQELLERIEALEEQLAIVETLIVDFQVEGQKANSKKNRIYDKLNCLRLALKLYSPKEDPPQHNGQYYNTD